MFSHYIIKTLPSNAESHEDQDGSKQKLTGGKTAKLWPIFRQGAMKTWERNDMKDLNHVEGGKFKKALSCCSKLSDVQQIKRQFS